MRSHCLLIACLNNFSFIYQVECKELFYRDLPGLDDSIADKLLPGCTTVEQVTFCPSSSIVILKCTLKKLYWVELKVKFSSMNCQVKDLLLQRCLEVEQTAREQVTDNAILDQLSKVILHH